MRSAVLAHTMSWTLRPFADLLPPGAPQIRVSRALVAAAMFAGCPPPHGVRVERVTRGSVDGDWIHPPGSERTRPVILYVHGSGYAICSARTHRGIASRLARLTGMSTFVVDYRLAPEHRFPAAAEDVETAYRGLLDAGVRPEDIAVVGDSAGGHLILDLLAENARRDIPQPGAAVLMSPLVDLTLGLALGREQTGKRDPLISARAARRLVRHYTVGQPDDLPRLRLALNASGTLPPTLIQAGGAEMLLDDARAAARMLTDAGADCELQVWPGQMHVFQALPMFIPEATPALNSVADFLIRTTAKVMI
ncbi:alpha/beta hydrolase [Gordonia sp. NPDC003504]